MATKEIIKEAAFKLFALKGYEATSTNDIGKEVGLTKQSLYSHFSSKRELFQEVLREQSDIISERLEKCFEGSTGDSTEAMLKKVFERIINIFSDRERLLFWKRAFIDYRSVETEITNDNDWHFDRKLKNELYRRFTNNTHISDPQILRLFFMSYMLLIQGYLDCMVIMGHDDAMSDNIWSNFWNGTKHFFKD
jgi:AcrR family transcriptional regulator